MIYNIHPVPACLLYSWLLNSFVDPFSSLALSHSGSPSCSSLSGTSARWRRRRWNSTSTFREEHDTNDAMIAYLLSHSSFFKIGGPSEWVSEWVRGFSRVMILSFDGRRPVRSFISLMGFLPLSWSYLSVDWAQIVSGCQGPLVYSDSAGTTN